MRHRHLLSMLAALLLVLAVIGFSLTSESEPVALGPTAASHPTLLAATAGAAASAPAVARSAGTELAHRPVSTPPKPKATQPDRSVEFGAEALRQMDRQWCSHGAQAYRQYGDSVLAQHGSEPLHFEYVKSQLEQWPAHRAMAQLRQDISEQWITALNQRGDVRSRATALFLASGMSGNADAATATAALSVLARGSADPYVAALAGQRSAACRTVAGCQPLSPTERLSKDPSNLLAFLESYRDAPELLRRLTEAVPKPVQARNYDTQLLQMLLDLPMAPAEGLYRQVEQDMLTSLYYSWSWAGYDAIRACRKLPPDAEAELGTCKWMAETLWNAGESMFGRSLALSMAKASRLTDRPAWRARQADMDAMKQHGESLQAGSQVGSAGADACEMLRVRARYIRILADQGDWYAIGAMRRQDTATPTR